MHRNIKLKSEIILNINISIVGAQAKRLIIYTKTMVKHKYTQRKQTFANTGGEPQ